MSSADEEIAIFNYFKKILRETDFFQDLNVTGFLHQKNYDLQLGYDKEGHLISTHKGLATRCYFDVTIGGRSLSPLTNLIFKKGEI